MKVSIVEGDERLFRAAAFGMPDRETIRRSYDRLDGFARNLSDRAREGLSKAREMIDLMYNEDVTNGLRIIERSSRGLYRRDTIQFLDSQSEIATAPASMRRWLLSHPPTRNLFDRQSLDGWGAKLDSFTFNEKGTDDPYWVAMRNGEIKANEKGEWFSDYTFGTSELTGVVLSPADQMDLIATVDVMEQLMAEGIDPTSQLGEKL